MGGPAEWLDNTVQYDERRQVFVLDAQTVLHPRSYAGSRLGRITATQEDGHGLVVGVDGVHIADDAQIVGMLAQLREQFADFQSAFPALFELPRRVPDGAGVRARLWFLAWHRLPVPLLHARLWVEGIHLTRATLREVVNDPLRFCGMMRFASTIATVCKQIGKSHRTQSQSKSLKHLPTIHRLHP